MALIQLIYASQPFGFDDLALNGILASAGPNNIRDDITGALICRDDLYLQLLEGPESQVVSAFNRILGDDRHTAVSKLVMCGAGQRLFPEWAMRHDPAQSWMWTADEVAHGAIARAPVNEIFSVFTRLASEPPVTVQKCPVHSAAQHS